MYFVVSESMSDQSCDVCKALTDDNTTAAAGVISDNTTAGKTNMSQIPASAGNKQNTSSSSAAAAPLSPSLVVGRGGVKRDIYAELSTMQHPDQHQHSSSDHHPPDHTDPTLLLDDNEIAYQRLRGTKETIYSKLKNRIRTLEDNLNLTNRYQYIFVIVNIDN